MLSLFFFVICWPVRAVKLLDFSRIGGDETAPHQADIARVARRDFTFNARARSFKADAGPEPPDAAGTQARLWLRELEAEIGMCRKLHHRHIVQYLGVQQEAPDEKGNPVVAIFMEFVPGGSIATLIERFGPLSEDVARRYTRQILLGLEYLHSCKVVHRDLKGGNVMVSRKRGVKIGDLGAATMVPLPGKRAAAPAAALDEAGPVVDESDLGPRDSLYAMSMRGSIYWMSPEILAGRPYGRRTDIW